jgi:hypothetical protein
MIKLFFDTRCCSLLLLTVFLFTGGCGPRVDEAGRHNISGKVTYDGNLLTTGEITFSPLETKAPEGAQRGGGVARIQSDGTYSLTRDTGLFEGTYQVAIRSFKLVYKDTGKDVDMRTYSEYEADSVKMVYLLPEKFYKNPQITITVGADKNQTHDLIVEK